MKALDKYTISDETIIACATPTETATALAVVRLSGPFSLKDINQFFSKNFTYNDDRLAKLVFIRDENQNLVDQVVATFFKGPHSFTGEHVLEISCHGNPLIVEEIIQLFCRLLKFRKALPGEFSFRAFKSKKMNLAQVEGLDLLINSATTPLKNSGLNLIQGPLYKSYELLRTHYKELKSSIDIGVDFGEDIGNEKSQQLLTESFHQFYELIKKLTHQSKYALNEISRPRVVLIGRPNAGKSTLFNYLLQENRSIVSSTPGTTRDYVSETIQLKSGLFRLIDTAGIRKEGGEIEEEGIKRSIQQASEALIKILVVSIEEMPPFEHLDFTPDLVIATHGDRKNLHSDWDNKSLDCPSILIGFDDNFKLGPIGPLTQAGPIGPRITKKAGPIGPKSQKIPGPIGPNLAELIFEFINKLYLEKIGPNPINLSRHSDLLSTVCGLCDELSTFIGSEVMDYGIIGQLIADIGNNLDELVGVVAPQEILDSIFAGFCIGK